MDIDIGIEQELFIFGDGYYVMSYFSQEDALQQVTKNEIQEIGQSEY